MSFEPEGVRNLVFSYSDEGVVHTICTFTFTPGGKLDITVPEGLTLTEAATLFINTVNEFNGTVSPPSGYRH